MNILSNDPRDIIRRQIKLALKDRGSKSNVKISVTSTEGDGSPPKDYISVEDIPPNATNPVGKPGFNPILSILTAVFAFWAFVFKKFWYWVPVIAGIMFYSMTPEEIAAITEQGITIGMIAKGALNYFLLGSVASLIPPLVIGNVLKNGKTIQKSTIVLLQIPAFAMAFLTLWSLGSIMMMFFKGIGMG